MLGSFCVFLCFLLILTLSAGAFGYTRAAAELEGGVNQSNVSSRLEAVNSGLESAIFQLLSKNMCSRYSYTNSSKSAADRINHMSFIRTLKKKEFSVFSTLCLNSGHSSAAYSLFVNSDLCPLLGQGARK